jgi:hypothetical protein
VRGQPLGQGSMVRSGKFPRPCGSHEHFKLAYHAIRVRGFKFLADACGSKLTCLCLMQCMSAEYCQFSSEILICNFVSISSFFDNKLC